MPDGGTRTREQDTETTGSTAGTTAADAPGPATLPGLTDPLQSPLLSASLPGLDPVGGPVLGGRPSTFGSWDATLKKRPSLGTPDEGMDWMEGQYHEDLFGDKVTLNTGAASYSGADGTALSLSESKGISYTQPGSGDGAKTTYGIGPGGMTFGSTHQVQGPGMDKPADAGFSTTLGPSGVKTKLMTGTGSAYDVSLGSTTSLGVTRQDKSGFSLGYDSKKSEVTGGIKTSKGFNLYGSIGSTGGSLGLGNKKMGISGHYHNDGTTLDAGGGLYYKGIGANFDYHSVTDKETALSPTSSPLLGGPATGSQLTNETGYSGGLGIKLLSGNAWMNDATTTGYLATPDASATDEEIAAQSERLKTQSSLGRDGLDRDALESGEAVMFSEESAAGGGGAVDAMGFLNYGYSGWSSDIDRGALAKRDDGTLVGSHTDGSASGGTHDYGALLGAWDATTGTTDHHERTVGVTSDGSPGTDAQVQDYAQNGYPGQTGGIRVGDEVFPGITIDHVSDVTSHGYDNEQDFLWGLGGDYTRHTSTTELYDERSLADGRGAVLTEQVVDSDAQGGHVLGIGNVGTETSSTTTSSAYVAGDPADTKKLRDITDAGQGSVALSDLKSGDQLSFSETKRTSDLDETSFTPVIGADDGTSTTRNKSTDIVKVDGGTVVTNHTDVTTTDETGVDVGWGLASSTSESEHGGSKTVVVVGEDGNERIQSVATSGTTDLQVGDKLDDGSVVQETSSSYGSSSSSSTSALWGASESNSSSSRNKDTHDQLTSTGKRSSVHVDAMDYANGSLFSTGHMATADIQAGPEGSSMQVLYGRGAAAGGQSSSVVGTTNLEPADMKAIADRYNEGEDAGAFWKRIALEAATAVYGASPKTAAIYRKVTSPEAFQGLDDATQASFVRAVISDIDDSNPFQAIALVELMEDPSLRTDAYSHLLEKLYGADEEGDGSLVAETWASFVMDQAKDDPGLYKQLLKTSTVKTSSS
jgi:hypothetical protein